MCATTAPVEFGALQSYCGSYASELGGPVGCFPRLEACVAPSVTMKASPQEGTFRSVPSQGPLCPVSAVEHDVFSRLWVQARAIAISSILWESL